MWDMGGMWKFSALYLLIPKVIRDALYKWIAKHRYRFFETRTECRLPEASAKSRFILD
jgi:predicted DCC family thiol-disulfide oxidoreductase YuxK